MFNVNQRIKVPKEVYGKNEVMIYIFDKYASDYFLIKYFFEENYILFFFLNIKNDNLIILDLRM